MIDDLYIEKNGDTYIQLQNDLKQGKIYTKDDLTSFCARFALSVVIFNFWDAP